MNHDHYSDEYLRKILAQTRTIALVGASPNEARPSYRVSRFLIDQGFELYPVNPGHAGKEINGRLTYRSLADIPVAIDLVDVFRNSALVAGLVEECLQLSPLPKAIWMQLGVRDDAAAKRAEEAGIELVMNRCPAIEIPRLNFSRSGS